MAIRTLSELFLVVAGFDKEACLMHKVGGRYVAVSTQELVRQVRQIARALVESGVRPGDRVALMAENGPHWPAVDFATLCIGAALVPIYPTLLPEGAAYVARDSGSRVLFVQGRERLEGLLAVRHEMPAVERIVSIPAGAGPGDAVTGDAQEDGDAAGVETLEAFMARGAGADQPWIEQMAARARPEDLATLIYTSGTTGDPKGVMLTHDNLVSNAVTGCEVLGLDGSFTALSFLPLSHSFERLVDYCFFYKGITIAYAESVQTVAANLLEVKPHVFVAVPRVYEKVMARVFENATGAGGLKAKIFRWAMGVGRQALPQRLAFAPAGLKVKIADRLVFSKIRERLGGRFVFAMSGGAPLGRDVAEFFWGAGIPIYEGYGLTETSPVISVNARGATRLGTVGRPMPRIEVRIAEDGEILSRGPNTMRGYYGKPEATAEAIDSEGWFHTGDIGHLDDGGFLVITDRKKELIVNAYGKNIAPAPIENALKASRWISQVVVIGDRRQYLAALIVPDFEVLAAWAAAEKLGGTIAEQLQNPRLRAILQTEVEAVNEHLARYEQIRVWDAVPAEFTLEGGELTPTLKVKRRVINVKYKAILDRLYAAGDAGGAN
ncbi:MAG: long-chain fatty acid--CoA ligase [Thermoanaerobaculia bacterium]